MHTESLARLFGRRVTRTLPVILALPLLVLPGCTTADVSSNTPQPAPCEERSADTNNLPTDVLIGTDIADSNHFEDSNAPIPGQYQAELGGATVTVSITTDTLTRTFQEPGVDPDRRTFQPTCVSGPHLLADGVFARRVSEGLLYLEPSSSVGGIPPNLWLLLDDQE